MTPRRGGNRSPRFDTSDHLLDAQPVAELDLHGCVRDEVERLVRGFLQDWGRRRPGAVVHIITGKGKGSASGAVLRPAVRTLLKAKLTSLVADWAPDHADGGYLVKLR